MFKLPDGSPTIRDSAQEWADYAELLAYMKGRISMYDLHRVPSIISDELDVNGIDDEDDKFNDLSESIIAELEYRRIATNLKYPFDIERRGQVLKYQDSQNTNSLIYIYLLLCTRNKMSTNRIFNDIDGSLLFEHLCGYVAQNYFGERSEFEILGTGRESHEDFRGQLRNIVSKMGEGGLIKSNRAYRPQDDKVDMITWKHFSDKKPSKLIAMGQCKTGTSWIDRLTELQTESFCKKWFTDQPVLTPIRLFFTTQFFPHDLHQIRAYEAGLIFDRFRIMDYLPDSLHKLDKKLVVNIKKWVQDLSEQ